MDIEANFDLQDYIREETPKVVETMEKGLLWFESIIDSGKYTSEDCVVYLTHLSDVSLHLAVIQKKLTVRIK